MLIPNYFMGYCNYLSSLSKRMDANSQLDNAMNTVERQSIKEDGC